MTNLNIPTVIIDITEGSLIGTILSVWSASVWPESIHGLAVVITSVAAAVSVFFTNRLLRKKFPSHKENGRTEDN